MKRIFVSIASYCDEECVPTIQDLFKQAAHPERITVGICWQYTPELQPPFCPVPKQYSSRVKQYSFHFSESKGAGWARHTAQSLYDGEDFILQIDSHMRFFEGWDEMLLEQHAIAPSDKMVMSSFCDNYEPGSPVNLSPYFFAICIRRVDNTEQIVHLQNHLLLHVPKRPFLSATVVFNFIFAPAEAFLKAPIDPYIYFRGAETTQAARFWTSGYDIYQPNKHIALHRWNVPPQPYKSQKNAWIEVTRKRVYHLLQIEETTDKKALQEIEAYGLGHDRPLKSFWELLGIDRQTRHISNRAGKGKWDKEIFPHA